FHPRIQKWLAPIEKVDEEYVVANLFEQVLKHMERGVSGLAVVRLETGGTERAAERAEVGGVEGELYRPRLNPRSTCQQLAVAPEPVRVGPRSFQSRFHQRNLTVSLAKPREKRLCL